MPMLAALIGLRLVGALGARSARGGRRACLIRSRRLRRARSRAVAHRDFGAFAKPVGSVDNYFLADRQP
jgi:hypothetical protein